MSTLINLTEDSNYAFLLWHFFNTSESQKMLHCGIFNPNLPPQNLPREMIHPPLPPLHGHLTL